MANFDEWSHGSLVSLAEDLMDENEQLQEDISILRSAWRELVKEKCRGAAPASSPSPESPPQ